MKNLFFLAVIFGIVPYNQPSAQRIENLTNELEQHSLMQSRENVWVFILAGQSNMAGRGLVEAQDTVSSERIFSINKEGGLVPAKEPLHFYEPKMAGLDCGLSFGKELLNGIPEDVSLLLIPTAVGGSSISQWLGDSTHREVPLLTNFLEKVEIGKEEGVIKGILWHQGESDANERDIPLYKDRLSRLFGIFREAVGNERLTILIGELGSFSKNDENWSKINDQISAYGLSDPFVRIVETDDLDHNGDAVHFDSEGQRLLGKRFAQSYLRHFN